jgi:predicted esterase
MTTVIFSHGQESGPWGTKIKAMAEMVKELGCSADSIDYQGIADPTERVGKLVSECKGVDDALILVGSSMGGHVATAAADQVNAAGLFVLAPAYYMKGHEELTPSPPRMPVCIVHGWHDDVVPVDNSIRFARQCNAELHLIDGDHRLTDNVIEICAYSLAILGCSSAPDEEDDQSVLLDSAKAPMEKAESVEGAVLQQKDKIDEAIEAADE